MLDVHFSRLYFCQSLHTLQRGLAAIADLLVFSRHSPGSSSLWDHLLSPFLACQA